ncbi:MAG: hypothetical protein NTV34_14520 [Proteobacteria bacterium]|nr:hypothetical protein [Pseudomonadota bacterium]
MRSFVLQNLIALSAVYMVALFCEESAIAGIYVSVGPNWNNFVFEPEKQEATPNYYGYGARGSFGYSIYDVWDLGLYGHYTPGKLNSASLTQEDARLWHGGGETGFRIAKALFIGVRGGPALYRLAKQTDDSEILGQWTGTMAQGSLGLILPVTKAAAWQSSLDVGQATLKSSDDAATKPRILSQISLTLSFVYNVRQTNAVETALFNHWIQNFAN